MPEATASHTPGQTPGQTRANLLEAAERLFSLRGHASVGTREIAEEAGVNLASIRYHFGSKGDLYLETVRHVMARRARESAWAMLDETTIDRADAAVLLVRFIVTIVGNLLDEGPQQSCVALMLWEAVQPSDAIDDVVRDYVKPSQDLLVNLVERLLDPADRPHAERFARSILGQVLHHRVFRPFIARMAVDPAAALDAASVAVHIARFSLRGMGCDETLIEHAITEAATPIPAPARLSKESEVNHTRNLHASVLWLAVSILAPRPAGAQDESHGPPPTPVRVALVETRTLQEHRKVTGDLQAVSRSKIATIEPGLVTGFPIEEGQIVEAGEVLAVLDSRRLEIQLVRLAAQIDIAQARIIARTAELEMVQSDVEALRALELRGASNPKELTDAASKVKMAVADRDASERDLAVARAEADLLRTRLADMKITAPFRGLVVTTETEVGEWLGEGETIAEVVAVGAVDAWLDVPQRYAPAILGTDALVQVRVDATGRTYEPGRPRVVPFVDRTARTFRVYRRLDDPEGRLAPGMTVTGWVPTGERGEYLTVPRDALLRNDAGFYVYIGRESPGGPAQAAPVGVEVLFADGDRVAVRGGRIAHGDAVVVEGNERLFPMMPIRYERPAPPAEATGSGARIEPGEAGRKTRATATPGEGRS